MTDEISDAEILRRAAQIMRARQGPEAAETRRAQMTAINAARTVKPCNCGRTDGKHPASCPEYHRAAQRRYAANKRAKKEGGLLKGEETASPE